jgi:hypothetical protein
MTPNPCCPDETRYDLIFVAKTENNLALDAILYDGKLRIARADGRSFFFRANERERLELAFDRLGKMFRDHKKTQIGDFYIVAGLDSKALAYDVRKSSPSSDRARTRPSGIR